MIRLFINPLKEELQINKEIKIIDKQFHYLINVMRSKVGDDITLIDGKKGEFLSNIVFVNNKYCILKISKQIKEFYKQKFLGLIFSPIQKMEILLKSASELGVTNFFPIITSYTNKSYLKFNKFEANILEAVEQSERMDIPVVHRITRLNEILKDLDNKNSIIFFCEERNGNNYPLNIYKNNLINKINEKNIYALVGPEGGFLNQEKQLIKSYDNVISTSLGNNILRTETAAISVLSILKAFYYTDS